MSRSERLTEENDDLYFFFFLFFSPTPCPSDGITTLLTWGWNLGPSFKKFVPLEKFHAGV